MNYLKSILTKACVYAIVILTVFYSFVTLDKGAIASIPYTSFLMIVVIGAFIAVSGIVFKLPKLNYIVKILINYAILLGSMFGVLISIGQLENKGPSIYIVVTFAFTVIYAAVFLISKGISKGMSKIDSKKGNKKQNTPVKSEYKPLYK